MKQSLFAPDGHYAKIMNWIWDVLVISVLWLLCCIPLFTIGAATSAAYYAAAKAIRAGEKKAAAAFFTAFRLNFKQSTFFTVLYGLVLLLLIFDCVYLFHTDQFPLVVLYLFYGMVLLTIGTGQYLFVFLSRFSLKKFQLFRMAVLCSFRHLISTILLLALLTSMIVGMYLMPWGILLFPGTVFYVQTYLMEPIMRKYMPEPGSGEEDKWYYFNKNKATHQTSNIDS